MRLITHFVLVATTLLSTGACASHRPASNEALVAPGQRVRVRLEPQPAVEGAAPRQLLRGNVVRVDADSLILRLHPAADNTAIARTGIDRIELSRGVPSRFSSAISTGAVLAVTGAIQRMVAGRFADYDETTWESAATGAAYGAVVGITVGAFRPQEAWRRLRTW